MEFIMYNIRYTLSTLHNDVYSPGKQSFLLKLIWMCHNNDPISSSTYFLLPLYIPNINYNIM